MDDKTLQALTAMAQKLGTTAEYLWGVLLRQAPISGAIDLAIMVFLVGASVLWARFVNKKTTCHPPTEENRYTRADWEEEGAFLAWLSVGGLLVISFVVISGSLATTVAALFNPEYWALRQILK
jgi:hypothetical protein